MSGFDKTYLTPCAQERQGTDGFFNAYDIRLSGRFSGKIRRTLTGWSWEGQARSWRSPWQALTAWSEALA